MRTLLCVSLTALLVGLAGMPVAADEGGDPEVVPGTDHFEGQRGGRGGGGGGGAGHGSGSGTAQQVVNDAPIYNVGLGETGDGEQCWRIETGGSQTLDEAREMLSDFDGNGRLFDACPRGQRGPTLAERVAGAFERWSPSPTTVEMAPGYAITGLKGFLVIDDATPDTITLVGQTVTLTKEYRIRWGDGASTTTSSRGVPYPGGAGEITHVYKDAGDVTVEVDLVVSGSWNGQDLGALAPVTSTLPLEIWQVQAVRRR